MPKIDVAIEKQFPKKVLPLIEAAKDFIDIIVYDWRWYSKDPGASVQLFNQSILRAVRRGVRVRVIVNDNGIFNILKGEGCQVKKLIFKGKVHCKMMIIDNQIVIIGSHNYTASAFEINKELSVILSELDDVLPFVSYFNNLFNAYA